MLSDGTEVSLRPIRKQYQRVADCACRNFNEGMAQDLVKIDRRRILPYRRNKPENQTLKIQEKLTRKNFG